MKVNEKISLLVAGILAVLIIGNFFLLNQLTKKVNLLEQMVNENTLDIYRGVK